MKGNEELNRELEDKHQAKAKGIRQNEMLEGDCESIEKQSSELKEKFDCFKVSDDEKDRAVMGLHRDDLQKLQGELKQTQDFIFDGAIGCWYVVFFATNSSASNLAATEFSALSANQSDTADQSCTSDVTWSDKFKLNKTNECKYDTDEFGLESDHNHVFSNM